MNLGGLKLVPQLSFQITHASQKAYDLDPKLSPDQNFDPKEFLAKNWNLTIQDLKNLKNEIGDLVLEAFKIVQENGPKWHTGQTLENVEESTFLVSEFFDNLVSWYTLSDLSLQTLKEIVANGFDPNYFNPVFKNLLKAYTLSNSKSEEDLLKSLNQKPKNIHLIGLFSTGTIHSDLRHWAGSIQSAGMAGAEKIVLHILSDGRDSDRQSLVATWEFFIKQYAKQLKPFEDKIFLGSVGGRFYAMDRDNNWDRVAVGLLAMLDSKDQYLYNRFYNYSKQNYGGIFEKDEGMKIIRTKSGNPRNKYDFLIIEGKLKEATYQYESGTFDEHLVPSSESFVINYPEVGSLEESFGIETSDTVWLINFRTDRMKQFVKMLLEVNQEFELDLTILGMNDYGDGGALELKNLDSNQINYSQANTSSSPLIRGDAPKEQRGSAFLAYNSNLTKLAKENRLNSTATENLLWNNVLKENKLGYKFLRQKPILEYIADFYCSQLALVVEIDGIDHDFKGEKDLSRQESLEVLGLKVVRFTNNEVQSNLESVKKYLQKICLERQEYLQSQEQTNPLPAKQASPLSGGNEEISTQKSGYYPVFTSKPVQNTLSENIAKLGKTQLHLAETEKYNHVTYFFNGGQNQKSEGEDWMVIPSNKVASHAEKPEMKVKEITDYLLENLDKYNYVVMNYANPDMVGHTGDLQAGIVSLEALDEQLGRLIPVIENGNHTLIITADHGNIEVIGEYEKNGKNLIDTEHNPNPVPLIIVNKNLELSTLIQNLAKTLKELNSEIKATDLEAQLQKINSEKTSQNIDQWLLPASVYKPTLPLHLAGVLLLSLKD
jgi:bisphosphoglycerate-independent phosphoglycerate mutase (AlkP superfamily)/very-short-patch-repair endonuclease